MLDVNELNLDGSHIIVKKGGELADRQGCKKGKASNILPSFYKNGYVLASTSILTGNHNDAFNLKLHLQSAFKWINAQGYLVKARFSIQIASSIPKKYGHTFYPKISSAM